MTKETEMPEPQPDTGNPGVEGAGGCITDWAGKPLGIESDGRILMSATRELHREALNALRTNRDSR